MNRGCLDLQSCLPSSPGQIEALSCGLIVAIAASSVNTAQRANTGIDNLNLQ